MPLDWDKVVMRYAEQPYLTTKFQSLFSWMSLLNPAQI